MAHLKDAIDQAQLAVAIIEDGEPRYIGYVQSQGEVKPIENHLSKYEIGSVTKVFTSTLLAGLVLENKVGLTANISAIVDLEIKDDQEISLLSLSNHTSGLPRLPDNLGLLALMSEDPYATYDDEDLQSYLLELTLQDSLIDTYQYSNLGAGLLGHVLCEKENQSYAELLQNRIFLKYGLTNSSVTVDTNDHKLVQGIGAYGGEAANWTFKALAGAGGIISTTEDLAKFAVAQMDDNNAELKLTREKTVTVNPHMDMGLGWHLLKKNDTVLAWHNGGTGGYSSSMALDVNSDNAVIILSNVSAGNPLMKNLDELCFTLMKTLVKKP